MFSTDRLNPDDAPMAQAAQATAEMLGQAMAALMTERQLPAASLPQRLLLAWSAVHGFATLVTEDFATSGRSGAHRYRAGAHRCR